MYRSPCLQDWSKKTAGPHKPEVLLAFVFGF